MMLSPDPQAEAKEWLRRIRALRSPGAFKRDERLRRPRALDRDGRAAQGAAGERSSWCPAPAARSASARRKTSTRRSRSRSATEVTLVAFGDMLRVPVECPQRRGALARAGARRRRRRRARSLRRSRRSASPAANPDRRVVFFAAGFETTTAPVAAMLAEGVPDNLSVLLASRLTWPAVAMLLDRDDRRDSTRLIAPGHVSTVMGPEEWQFVPEQHGIPAAVAGFDHGEPAGRALLGAAPADRRPCFLDNCYPEVVRPGGNPTARRQLDATMDVVDANWRGIGIIPASGLRADVRSWPLLTPQTRSIRRSRTPRASAPARCRPDAIARAWCWAASIRTSACCSAAPARRARRSAPAWCRTKAPAVSGGRRGNGDRARRRRRMIERALTFARERLARCLTLHT